MNHDDLTTIDADTADPAAGLAALEKAVSKSKGLPPVHLWNPPFCGEIDIRIGADGLWYYMGTPIGREPLVRLFSSILRKDEDGKIYLVTPVEKIGISVDDAPFLIVHMEATGKGEDQTVKFTTKTADDVIIDDEHPIRFEEEQGTEGLKPYVLLRGRLEALVNRPIFYDLVNLGMKKHHEGEEWFGVWSSGRFWPMARAGEIGI
ncbi:MAG: DUF1285 domain-containing protein [Hyphomicrobiales bacterium]